MVCSYLNTAITKAKRLRTPFHRLRIKIYNAGKMQQALIVLVVDGDNEKIIRYFKHNMFYLSGMFGQASL